MRWRAPILSVVTLGLAIAGCTFDPSGPGAAAMDGSAAVDASTTDSALNRDGAEALRCGGASNVVACYDFESDLLDRSGFENHGVAAGSPAFGPGHTLQGLVLDGVDDAVRIDDAPSLDATDLTVDLWLSPASFGSDNEVRIVVDYHSQWALTIDDDDAEARCVMLSGLPIVGGSLPDLDTFYHVACTANSARSRLFLNGDEVACAHRTMPPPIGATEGLALGADRSNGGGLSRFFHGTIDSVRIADTVRSPQEICAIVGRSNCTTLDPSACIGP